MPLDAATMQQIFEDGLRERFNILPGTPYLEDYDETTERLAKGLKGTGAARLEEGEAYRKKGKQDTLDKILLGASIGMPLLGVLLQGKSTGSKNGQASHRQDGRQPLLPNRRVHHILHVSIDLSASIVNEVDRSQDRSVIVPFGLIGQLMLTMR